MFTKVLYITAISCLFLSFMKDKNKTKVALKNAWKSFEKILPSILTVLLIIGMILSILDKETVSKLLGSDSGVFGMILAGVIGCITLMPGFVAFPLTASLLEAGAGYGQIAMFISTLMMVGIATLPLESTYFGKKVAIKRNFFSLILAIIIAIMIGGIMG